jgi:hypothetical protein
VQDPDDSATFADAVQALLADPGTFRDAVVHQARPQLVDLLAPAHRWMRFRQVVGL